MLRRQRGDAARRGELPDRRQHHSQCGRAMGLHGGRLGHGRAELRRGRQRHFRRVQPGRLPGGWRRGHPEGRGPLGRQQLHSPRRPAQRPRMRHHDARRGPAGLAQPHSRHHALRRVRRRERLHRRVQPHPPHQPPDRGHRGVLQRGLLAGAGAGRPLQLHPRRAGLRAQWRQVALPALQLGNLPGRRPERHARVRQHRGEDGSQRRVHPRRSRQRHREQRLWSTARRRG